MTAFKWYQYKIKERKENQKMEQFKLNNKQIIYYHLHNEIINK